MAPQLAHHPEETMSHAPPKRPTTLREILIGMLTENTLRDWPHDCEHVAGCRHCLRLVEFRVCSEYLTLTKPAAKVGCWS